MWMKMILSLLGVCFGVTIASGVVAFIISLGIIPRYAGITRTARRERLYEDFSMLGAVTGNLLSLTKASIPVGVMGCGIMGLFAGIFLGGWVVALGEVVNLYAILVRRIGITRGISYVILCMAAGKMIGSFLFFLKIA